MLTIGCHLSSSKGYLAMGKEAVSIGANTFQFFTRNPRGSKAKAIDEADVAAFLSYSKEHGIERILAHAPYTLNPCSKDAHTREFAWMTMADDLKRMEYTPGNCYNFHPGSHLKQISVEECLNRVAESINLTLDKTYGVTAVIENTAGQGSNIGYKFEHLAYIINRVEDKSRVGVCIDTCHTFAGGYDIATAEGFEKTFREFDEIIGFKYLRAMHLNDSKKGVGSHIDRHESLGKGELGTTLFRLLMQDSRFDNIPLILETPNEDIWAKEISWLYSL